jgi:TPR repeat protein
MFLNTQRALRYLAFFTTLLFATWRMHAAGVPSADELPAYAFDNRFSTNWYALVRTVLPHSYSMDDNFDFQKATNALCRESRRRNPAAKALWGMALIITGNSQETKDSGLQLLRDSADEGYVPAMLNLGYLYEAGKVVRLNYTEAYNWFKQAADLGVVEAQLQLGGCYEYGLGVTPDLSMAARYYRLSAGQTNFVAMKSLGYLLENGYGIEKNEDAARHWFLRAATEGGNRRAMYNLGALCCQIPADTNATLAGFKWIKQSAELGDALAAYEVAKFYYSGRGGIETNLASYHYWLLKAAFLGATDAQFFVGQAYRTGDGLPKDPENSLIWYGKAAAKNHPDALHDLALLYLEQKTNRAAVQLGDALILRAAQMGHREAQFQCALWYLRDDIHQDCDAGREWMSTAAENGSTKAEFVLFQSYYYGIGLATNCPFYTKDKADGIRWRRLAAEHGNLQAQSTLALMMIRGSDIEQNKTEAENLLREAAGHGFGLAQGDLGFAILNGDTSSTDLVEAAMWCKLALSHSTDTNVLQRTTYNLSRITARLTIEQQQEAERRADDFQIIPIPYTDPKIKGWEKNPNYQREDGQFGH